MSDTTPKGEAFEATLAAADQQVAEFEDNRRSFIDKLQHVLHENPALVPLIVLVMSLGIFAILV